MTDIQSISAAAFPAMEAYLKKTGFEGVALVAVADADDLTALDMKMKAFGHTSSIEADGSGFNFRSIVCAKMGELLETGADSGSNVRPIITGEFGWKGAVSAVRDGKKIIVSFSGATEDEDLNTAKCGMEAVLK